jgi:CspA family cold shock protein
MNMVGKVLWFDVKKGFGFIRSEDGKDVFAHYSKIVAEPGEFKLLEEGEEVEFEVFMAARADGTEKPQAKDIKRKEGSGRSRKGRKEEEAT